MYLAIIPITLQQDPTIPESAHHFPKNEKEKAVKKGNSYSNDKIAAKVPVGDVIIPRSVSKGKDPVKGSAEFVAKALAKRRKK